MSFGGLGTHFYTTAFGGLGTHFYTTAFGGLGIHFYTTSFGGLGTHFYTTVQYNLTLYTTKWGPVKEENHDQDVIQCDQ